MLRFALVSLGTVVALFGLDYYVFRNWHRFVRRRPRLRGTLPLYRVLMAVMPFVLPAYFYLSNWWEVEPKALRAAVIGLWALYYLPKLLIALALAVKDVLRGVTWLFAWLQWRLHTARPPEPPPGEADRAGAIPDGPAPTEGARPERRAVDLADLPSMTRGEFLKQVGWSLAGLPYLAVGYSVFKTLYDFEVHRVDVPIAGLPRPLDGLTIAQVSDLHAGSFFSPRPMGEAVDRILALRPDAVAITGDFVNHDHRELAVIAPALARLRADLGVFGCLGNHDHYARVPEVVQGVRRSGVDLLVNQHRTVEVDGARLHIVGTDNTGFRQNYADLPRALAGLDPGDDAPRVLLAHDPTFWDGHVRPKHAEIDLMLCGHTHGGQVGFEWGPIRWSPAGMVYDRWAGLYTETGRDGRPQHLYVNRGLGTVGPPLRLGIAPEITLLTLRRA